MSDVVYVSSVQKDTKLIGAIVGALEVRGIRCWYAQRDLGLGSAIPFETSLQQALGNARALLLLFTDWANKSRYIVMEVAEAIAGGVPIILLTADDSIHLNPDLERLLSGVRWARVHTLSEVHAALSELMGLSVPEPAAPALQSRQLQTVELLFASNREQAADGDAYFSSGRAPQTTFGKARVVIPANHQAGVIERPGLFSSSKDNAFRIESVETIDRAVFVQQIRQRFQPLVLFVHGYCTTFVEAVINLAQVSWDAELTTEFTPILFSWPSKGGYFGYPHDMNSVIYSRRPFRGLVDLLRSEMKSIPVDIIAHSLGNLLTLDGLRELGGNGPHIRELIMAAPDVDVDVFYDAMKDFQLLTKGMTLYASARDWAMSVSSGFSSKARAGEVPEEGPVVADHLDSIDVSEMAELIGWNHSTYRTNKTLLKDIRQLLTTGTRPPDQRSDDIHGMPGQLKPPRYWKYTGKG
jgi:esterase/lipase superfamily enzyme